MRTDTLKIEKDRRRNERMARTKYICFLLEGSNITAHTDLGEHVINNVDKGLKETLRSVFFLISQCCVDHSIVNLLCLTFWQCNGSKRREKVDRD